MKLNNINTKYLGKKVVYYETIDSTQKEIWRRVKQKNIESGTVIITDIQTEGIGTHGRIWHTDSKNNIAFSFFLKTDCKLENIQGITIEIAETIVKVIKETYNITLNIKYPNDIIYKNKKIGGILTETKVQKEKVRCIVVGIGINTNQEKFTGKIENIATSIKKEFGINIKNELIITKFCELFEEKLINRKIN